MASESDSGGAPEIRSGAILLNRYELHERLAAGGFAAVWRANDRLLEQEIALKLLHANLMANEAVIEDVKRETLRTRELSHPCIVKTYDFIQGGNVAGITMELIDGDTLSDRAKKKESRCFDTDEIRNWIDSTCGALAYAHAERGAKKTVVHHDLKPGNLMVDRYDHLKVLDFGISKTITETQYQVTGKFQIAGTLPYMSPQQLMGSRPSVADDVYGLGATIYALLTGSPPFFRGNIEPQIREEVPPSIANRRKELDRSGQDTPPEWEETVAAALAKDPERRPSTIREMAERLGLDEPTSSRWSVSTDADADAKKEGTRILGSLGEAITVLTTRGEEPGRARLVRALSLTWRPVALLAGLLAGGVAVLLVIIGNGESGLDPSAARTDPAPREIEPAATPSEPDLEKEVGSPVDPDGEVASALEDAGPFEASGPHDEPAVPPSGPVASGPATTPDPEPAGPLVTEPAPTAAELLHTALHEVHGAIDQGATSEARRLLAETETEFGESAETRAAALRVARIEVEEFLAEYRAACESLDLGAYTRLWENPPASVRETVARSFQATRSLSLEQQIQSADVRAEDAKMRVRERRRYDLKAGGPQMTTLQVVFELVRVGGSWKIKSLTAQPVDGS